MPTRKSAEAKAIAEEILRITGEGLMTDNFDVFRPAFHLPHDLETFEGKIVISTVDELRAIFDAVVSELKRLGATDLVRYCAEAEFTSDTVIKSAHVSNTMRGALRIKDPTSAYSVFEKIDGDWRIISSTYAVPDDDKLNTELISAHLRPMTQQIQQH